jgi:DNA primase
MKTRIVNLDDLKDEIGKALPISTVAEELCGVELVQSGNQQKGLCPFHEEDTPSFYVNDARGVYHCFGCKAGGDAIGLLRDSKHLDFFEAIRQMADAAKVDLSKYERPLTREEQEQEAARAEVVRWFDALPYAVGRQEDMCREFGVKYQQSATKPLNVPGVERYHQEGVLFPMLSVTGDLVGWRARTENKRFFATPRDFLLHEPTFFGLPQAREGISKTGEVVVVEGEYDCMACHAVGVTNVVAIGGSKFTEEHMEVLRRLRVKRAVFLFDGDQAGREAGEAVAAKWWQGDVRCFIAELPSGTDPDELVQESGSIFLENIIKTAKWSLEYALWQEWLRRPGEMSDKIGFVEWIAETYGGKLSEVEEALVAQHVAKWLELPEAQVFDFTKISKSDLFDVEAEQIVLGESIRKARYYQAVRKTLTREDFYMVRHQRVWAVLEEIMVEGLEFDAVVIKQRAQSAGVEESYINLLLSSEGRNLEYHEQRICDLSVRRSARDAADRFRERIGDLSLPTNETIGDLTVGVTKKALGPQSEFRTITEQVDQAMDIFYERAQNPDVVHGIDLGPQFPILTKRLQGIQKRRLVLVAALSGVGKTTITIQWAVNMAVSQSIPVDYISLEMDETELLYKAASHLTGLHAEKINAGALNEDETRLFEKAMMRISKSPLKIHVPDEITASEFVMYARESVMDRRTEVFFLDYVQMVSPDPAMSRKQTYEQLKEFGRMAKSQVARAMDVSVICPAQLNKMSGEKERPTKEDMGDSYDLSRTADVVIILKGNQDGDNVDLWLDKNRQGAGNHLIPTVFDSNTQTFHEQGGFKEPDYRLT